MTRLRVNGLSNLRSRWARFALLAGPGLVVMLADTDAGSIITAAQSGAQWAIAYCCCSWF
jgi:Mn2+/Fe2+ NRAMP family transporter